MFKGQTKFSPDEVIAAIPGTGGIIAVIARRLQASWPTVNEMIQRFPEVKAAWEGEREAMLDDAESVVASNIKLAAKIQERDKLLVDTSDAKWMLSKRGKHRGYGDKVEVEQGGEVIIRVVYETGNSQAPDTAPETG